MDLAEPVVRTAGGLVRGHRADPGGIAVFRGIPFARPPVGELRFQARSARRHPSPPSS